MMNIIYIVLYCIVSVCLWLIPYAYSKSSAIFSRKLLASYDTYVYILVVLFYTLLPNNLLRSYDHTLIPSFVGLLVVILFVLKSIFKRDV
jgi:hypothetical protein